MPLEPLSISNPELGFRLDPGEPGLLRRAKASEATLRVTAQEQRNLARLESEARMAGRVIIYSGIHYGKSFAGGYMTTTNGLTTVISREPRPGVAGTEAARSDGGAPPARAADLEEREPAPRAEGAAAPGAAGGADRAISTREDLLRAELRRLESPGFGMPIEETDPAAARNDPLAPLADAAGGARRSMREGRAREIEGELRRLEFARLARGLGLAGGGASSPAAPTQRPEPLAIPA